VVGNCCCQGMNRSQVMRLALCGAVRRLRRPMPLVARCHSSPEATRRPRPLVARCHSSPAPAAAPDATGASSPRSSPASEEEEEEEEEEKEEGWVSRAHGAVSGCDAHTAFRDVTEENFFGYLFDPGHIFARGYDPRCDTDPQEGPLQRGFQQAFGVRKQVGAILIGAGYPHGRCSGRLRGISIRAGRGCR
jgi:hypothetical protein